MFARLDSPPRATRYRMPELHRALVAAVFIPFFLPLEASLFTLAGFGSLILSALLLAPSMLIPLLPVLAVIGPYFLPLPLAGVTVFGFRLMIMLLAAFSTPLTTRATWWANPIACRALLLGLLWLTYALFSLFWTLDVPGGLADVVTIVFGFALVLVLLALKAHHGDNLDKLRFGWLVALAVAVVMALFEISTGDHLPSKLYDAMPQYFDGSVVQSTLGSPAGFGAFLLVVTPFVLWSMEMARGPGRLFYLGGVIGICFLMLYSASRLSLIGLAIEIAFYFIVIYRRWYIWLLVPVAAVAAAILWTNVFMKSDFRMAQKLNTIEETGEDASIQQRLALTINGLWMTYKTAGAGVGAAGFEEEIERGNLPAPLPIRLLSKWNAHNVWVEILSEYGVLVFGALMALLGQIGMLAWRAQRDHTGMTRAVGRAVLTGYVGYLFYGVVSGTAFLQSVFWIFTASLFIMGAFLHDQLNRSSFRPGR